MPPVVTRTANRGRVSAVGEKHGQTRRASETIASLHTDQLESLRVTPSGTKTRSCRPHVLVDEPAEEISPFDVGHAVGLFDGSETFRYLKLQSAMRASPVVMLHIDPKDAIEMPRPEDQQPVQALCAKRPYPALGEGVRVRCPDRISGRPAFRRRA